jgi:hypothetical protein
VAQVNAIREAAQVAFEQKDVQLLQSILPKATTRQDQVPTYPYINDHTNLLLLHLLHLLHDMKRSGTPKI